MGEHECEDLHPATMLFPGQAWIQWLLAWSASLHRKSKPIYFHRYYAQPISIDSFFDSVATVDFDGQGSYYPAPLLPHGVLKSENVDVSRPSCKVSCIPTLLCSSPSRSGVTIDRTMLSLTDSVSISLLDL